ncbi:45056_t:CDS:2 [Gigaspora margarita]|uniref:45056_t:CDS:1 n=1 Tax=Gigaspora margarita TaxID=4874 RepID=A0ABN7VG53_GIGMA|nr:45056_t:CDS:2 [Gigaspora margarita]
MKLKTTHRKLERISDPKYNREYKKTTRTYTGIKEKPRKKKRRQGPSKRIKKDLYQTTIYRKCKEKEESFDLTAYEVDEARWLEKEYSIANQIWSNLDTVVRKRMTIGDLYTSLTGRKEADKYRKRNYMARELIESDLATSLLAMEITRKKTKKASSEEKRKKSSVGKVIDKGGGGDLYEEFEDELRRQKLEDKR